MHSIFRLNRQRMFVLTLILFAVSSLFAVMIPAMASTLPTSNTAYATPTNICYTQLQSDPSTTYTSTNSTAVQAAVSAATTGDVIKIAGVCRGTSDISSFQIAYIHKDVTLQGGFSATNWVTPDSTSPTVLDADRFGRVIRIDNNIAVTLMNLQLTNGDATGLGEGPFGGFDAGGGIHIGSGAVVKLVDVQILNNKGSLGAGLYNLASNVHIERSVFDGNFGREDNSNLGGGIYNDTNGYIFVSDTTFSRNTLTNSVGSSSGAGIYNHGVITITTSTFEQNIADMATGNGGGINNNSNGRMIISQSAFFDNAAAIGGGLTNSALITIVNSTFSQNNAVQGAAIYNSVGEIYGKNNSIISNIATSPTGGSLDNGYEGKTYLTNTIIGNNRPSDCSFSSTGVLISGGFNLDSDGTCIQNGQPSDSTASDIGAAPLADNGGKTATHALLLGSPAIDAGNCSNNEITTDQRGVLRPQRNGCDIGAFEKMAPGIYIPIILVSSD